MPEIKEETIGNVSAFAAPKIAIGVSKGRSGVYALKWALEKEVAANGLVYLIHVQSPLRWVPNALGGKFPVEQVRPAIVKRFKEKRFLEAEKLVDEYKRLCDKKKIKSKVCYSESDSVQKELVSQVSKFGITKLVLGTSSQSVISRALRKVNISKYVAKHAPGFCTVMVVYKGKLLSIKDATQGLTLHCSSPSSNSAAGDASMPIVSEINRGRDDVLEGSIRDFGTGNGIQDVESSMWSGVGDDLSTTTLSLGTSMDFSQCPSDWLLSHSRNNNGAFHSPPMNVMMKRNRSAPCAVQCSKASTIEEEITLDSIGIMNELTTVAAANESIYKTMGELGRIQHLGSDPLSQSTVNMETSIITNSPTTQRLLHVHGNNLMGPSMALENRAANRTSEVDVSQGQLNEAELCADRAQRGAEWLTNNFRKAVVASAKKMVGEHERHRVDALRKAMKQATKDAKRCEEALAALQLAQKDQEAIQLSLAEEVKRHRETQMELEAQKQMVDVYAREAALATLQAEAEKSRCEETTVKLEDVTRNLEAECQLRKEAEEKASLEAAAKLDALATVRNEHQRYSEYSFQELQLATNDFNVENKLGEGGYGPVYKGKLHHTTVAIKVLARDRSHGREEFQREVELLSRVHHPHMLMLLGACPGKGCIVYEYMANGSLEDRLNCKGGTTPLPWYARFRICLEVATALLFLHSQPQPIVHRDLKPGNILLDRHFVSKIGDVGLARFVPYNLTFSVTIYKDSVPVGTFAYIDPDYQRTGVVSCESDVYSLGIVMLQLLTGRPAVGVPDLVEAAVKKGKLEEVLDKSAGEWPLEEARRLARISLQCAEPKRKKRPRLGTDILPELEAIQTVAEIAAANMVCVGPSSSGTRPVIPSFFFCPILQEIMEDPHIAADGFTYEQHAIKVWLQANNTSPMTNLKLEHKKLTPNLTLRSAIKEWYENGMI